jgi:DNA polymerase III alpha subunit (gram-positive type)
MYFNERPIIITDVETTGLDPRFHEIVEIGAIKVDADLNELARFDLKVRPIFIERAEPEALAINGYNAGDWADAAGYVQAAQRFSTFSAEGVLAAWNITFEYNFLDQMFRDTRAINRMDHHRIDMPSIAWALLPNTTKLNLDLDLMGGHFGMPPEQKPHRGIRGAEYELALLKHLRGLLR